MKEEGLVGDINVDLDNLPDKEFVTYRATKSFNENVYSFRYNPWNLFTKNYTMKTNSVIDEVKISHTISL